MFVEYCDNTIKNPKIRSMIAHFLTPDSFPVKKQFSVKNTSKITKVAFNLDLISKSYFFFNVIQF